MGGTNSGNWDGSHYEWVGHQFWQLGYQVFFFEEVGLNAQIKLDLFSARNTREGGLKRTNQA